MIVLVHNVFVLQQTCRVKQHVDRSRTEHEGLHIS